MALTLEKLLLLLPYSAKPDEIKTLDLVEKGIVALPKQTSFLKSLRRLNLSRNVLTDVSAIASITTLTHLDLSQNVGLKSLVPLKQLTGLVVLSISGCGLRSLEGIEGSKKSLKSLVANDNNIILGVDKNDRASVGLLPIAESNRKALLAIAGVVETIVLSRNPALTGGYELGEDDPSVASNNIKSGSGGLADDTDNKVHIAEDPKNPLHFFGSFEQLRKLSLSECGIKCLPRRWFLPMLTELRLANNKISTISNGVVLKSLKVIDVSHNNLSHWNVLHRCKFLKQLSIKGNPLNAIDTEMPTQTSKASWEAEAPPPPPPQSNKKGGGASSAPPTAAPTAEEVARREAAAANAPSSALHDNPLEVLYLRAVMPQLDILDGRKFVNPPPGATPEVIQKSISTIHKREHLARKAKAAKEELEKRVIAKKAEDGSDDEGGDDAASFASEDNHNKSSDADNEVALLRKKKLAGGKGIRVGKGDDEDEETMIDASLLARKRRRIEESEGTSEPSPKAPLEPIEDKEYEVPAAIAAKARLASSQNLIKREKRYVVDGAIVNDAPTASGTSHHKNGGNKGGSKAKPVEKVLVDSGSDVLAAMRQTHSSAGGW